MSAPTTAGSTADVKPTSLAELSAAFPDLVNQARAEGASAERKRITAIQALAGKRRGVDAEMAAAIGDPTCTPEKFSMILIEAENARLEAAAANIRGVEEVAKDVRAAPAAAADVQQTAAATPEGWREEYARSKDLQNEFGSVETYVAYQQGLASGAIRILKTRATG